MDSERILRNLRLDLEDGGPTFALVRKAVLEARQVFAEGRTPAESLEHPLVEGVVPVLLEPLLVVDDLGAVLMSPGNTYSQVDYVIYIDVADFGVFQSGSVFHLKSRQDNMLAFRLRDPRYALRDRKRGWVSHRRSTEIEKSVLKVLAGESVTYHERSSADAFLLDFKNNIHAAVRQVRVAIRKGTLQLEERALDHDPLGTPSIDLSMGDVMLRFPKPPKA